MGLHSGVDTSDLVMDGACNDARAPITMLLRETCAVHSDGNVQGREEVLSK
ncbi:unnamed protein product [Ilex paraguariensis]|uniref:Uncharacterized protein n=1 Tax=Ilex paraguariensis TaxID=185542 RepID=A0ABC8RTG5_9AQUA